MASSPGAFPRHPEGTVQDLKDGEKQTKPVKCERVEGIKQIDDYQVYESAGKR
jgi:hypothetical protein